ncbi:MAG: YgfZ/GcvT domain-containing protein [Methyloceanibacter sp.]
MSHCEATLLADRGALRITGAEARKFLQGVITNDINKLRDRTAIHTGLLSPQGKVLYDFFVIAADDGLLIDVARAEASELAKRLGFYRLRARAEISEEPSFTVGAVWGGEPQIPEGVILYADPRLPELGFRILLPPGADMTSLGCSVAPEADYHIKRIALGVPDGGRDYAYGDVFPHEALFDQLNGVDFEKGCFVGQEVVSRMQHRGTARKRVVPVEGNGPLPAPGTGVEAGGRPLGALGSVSGASGLALLRLDRAGDAIARGTPLKAGDVTLTLRRPAFARFDVPSAVPA